MQTSHVIQEHIYRTSKALLDVNRQELEKVVSILREVRRNNYYVWLLGNGGSAATASHFANDLLKQCGIRAVSIPDMISTVTAYGNDEGWHQMFSLFLNTHAGREDVIIAFSCSGNSANVVEVAKGCGRYGGMIIFTGNDRNSPLVREGFAQCLLFVESPDILVQESVHLALCHAIVSALKKE